MAPSYLATFRVEAADLLESIEAAVLELEARGVTAEVVDELFRAFHTLKGSAGVAGMTDIASFAHHVESAMEGVRAGRVQLTGALATAILAAKDHVASLLADPPGDPAAGVLLVQELAARGHAAAEAPADEPAPASSPAIIVEYLVAFEPTADVSEAFDHVLGELRALGPCDVLAQPGPGTAEWRLMLRTRRGEDAIRDAFIFIQNDGSLTIDQGLCEFAYDEPAPAAAPPERVATAATTPAIAAAAPPARATKSAAESTVRVPSARLDQLVKLVGELVITQSRLAVASARNPEAAEPVEALERLVADLRDQVLALRMVPIGTTFTRFHRLIRDLSRDLGKEVDLVTSGDETELDKTVIEQLGDALVHILRNSMDHGIEPPAARVASGKPPRGTLRLGATHDGAHITITISDDGRGVDTAAVRRKAEALGLVGAGDVLSESETIELITRPGFSTAAAVTEVSGRGVGMDVVRQTIEQLRGTLAITSTRGAGMTIRLELPLSLAIIDGLLVEIGRDRFIVPLAAVTENVELTAAERRANNGRNVVALRGEWVPYVRLRDMFAMDGDGDAFERVVVVEVDRARVGIVVDRIVGVHQTVIQPLGRLYRGVDMFSGTTIMGDGRVAMILDLARTIRRVGRQGTEPDDRGFS
jgi:two-component system, chemotaxis family, sensor kinase CheA